MKILIGKDHDLIRKAGGIRHFYQNLVRQKWNTDYRIDWTVSGSPVKAFINNSAWTVQCPRCPEVIYCDHHDPVFFCPECVQPNSADNPTREVIFPENREEIESTLLRRPNPLNRNWLPDETVEDLLAENLAHGVGGGD